ncbi:branched-chain amino acid ABC transporter permease [Pikeienuella piscinae]|uniref:Branched-chain amino acid ABC transporter permease n=1 Tax=Pikeienuella piscinae TaxID=2748098 RepID=A0A7L5C001_9RHOB|nr:branched-chain amino acid ABC transporter permease [Pikeienuella piscinae]QIE56703.1 branched-chain amino acid ABC transporter permease [Pikeienuella piscinae]
MLHLNARSKAGLYTLLLAVLAIFPLIVEESNLFLTVDVLIAALFAMSYNIVLGQTGLLSFGHAAFYGLGAYTVALLQMHLGWPIEVGIVVAPLVTGAFALAIGFFTVRVSGMYFAMLTLAFSQLIFAMVAGWYSFTGGDNGAPVMPPDYLFDTTNFYYLALGVVTACICFIRLLVGSPFGAALAAIRENPERARFIGVDIRFYQLAAFTISGALTGIAGALQAAFHQMAFPSLLFWPQSAEPVLMTLAGGIQTFFGPAIGAALFTILNFFVASYTDYPLFVFGVVVLVLVLFLPDGIVGTLFSKERRYRPGAPKDGAELAVSANAPKSPKGAPS